MAHQINLNDEEYAILVTEAAKSGLDPEQFLHKIIYKMQPSTQWKRPSIAQELAEKQHREGKIARIPTGEPLTQEELDTIEMCAKWFAGGKPLSEMIIEDRGPY